MKNVYLHEFNVLMEEKVYLPAVSGMLRACAEARPDIASNYQFMPFLFVRQQPKEIIKTWDNPSVLAFSSSMWNHQLNLFLAKKVRELFPKVLIVFGGPHVPAKAEKFLKKNCFIDVAVRGEGEVTFAELLSVFLHGRDFSGVAGITYRRFQTDDLVVTPDRQLVDINQLPSPYLSGFYDDILDHRDKTEYQMILETNRGCPFNCSFCFWGNGFSKIRMFDLKRVEQEIEWAAKKKIQYVFGADANFGMLARDILIAQFFAKQKKQTGFPRSFRVCYGKNAVDRIFTTAELLERNHLTTGVTVSFQSTNSETLRDINRSNIRLDTYRELLCRYRAKHIRVYTELILGLPGETYESFSHGIEEVFQAGLYDQVGIFLCQVLPNTEMADSKYAFLHGIKTKRLELAEPHASPRSMGEVSEYEDIVVATKSMSHEDWKRSIRLAWMAQTIHGMKLGFFITLYLFERFGVRYTELFEYLIKEGQNKERFPVIAREIEYYENYLAELLAGKPQCIFLPEFGKISWQIEEATFLRLNGNLVGFYDEMKILVSELLMQKGMKYNPQEINEVVLYQMARVSCLNSARIRVYEFSLGIPEYFDSLLNDKPGDIHLSGQILKVKGSDYSNDKELFAKLTIWFGRRDCRTLEQASWC